MKERKEMMIKKVLFPILALILALGMAGPLAAPTMAAGDESYSGYNLEQSKWTHGNLGKAYTEGDWVSYQLVITSDSKLWGATSFDISWNFHQDSSGAVYIDGFKNFQVGSTLLGDTDPVPYSGWGVPLTVGDDILNYQDPWNIVPPASEDPADPDDERYFVVTQAGTEGDNFSWTGDQIVLFYQAHLALSIIWSNGLEAYLPSVLDGDAFESWTAEHHGASFATGPLF